MPKKLDIISYECLENTKETFTFKVGDSEYSIPSVLKLPFPVLETLSGVVSGDLTKISECLKMVFEDDEMAELKRLASEDLLQLISDWFEGQEPKKNPVA